MKPQKMFAAVQGAVVMAAAYSARSCRREAGILYRDSDSEAAWDGWKRARKSGVKIVRCMVFFDHPDHGVSAQAVPHTEAHAP
jgi:hypothetical protein